MIKINFRNRIDKISFLSNPININLIKNKLRKNQNKFKIQLKRIYNKKIRRSNVRTMKLLNTKVRVVKRIVIERVSKNLVLIKTHSKSKIAKK